MLAGCVAPGAQVRPAAPCHWPSSWLGALLSDLTAMIPAAGVGEPQQGYAGWRRAE